MLGRDVDFEGWVLFCKVFFVSKNFVRKSRTQFDSFLWGLSGGSSLEKEILPLILRILSRAV